MLDAAGELVPAPPDRSRLTVSRARLWRYLMPRAMWKGAISFGLVTIPVAVYPATEEKTLRFNQLHEEDGGRIRMKRTCSVDGEEVPYEHIVKGYEYEKDRYVILTDEDFDGVDVDVKVREQELQMARQLIENLTGEWNPEEFTDEYREALLKIVEA